MQAFYTTLKGNVVPRRLRGGVRGYRLGIRLSQGQYFSMLGVRMFTSAKFAKINTYVGVKFSVESFRRYGL